ncbi:hypothetical protein B0H21DRAFT_744036 [Amylocystis lapponica]|nr:hypothetical protein B0H21DRAFT_744036 [Amylocystis lapponica]
MWRSIVHRLVLAAPLRMWHTFSRSAINMTSIAIISRAARTWPFKSILSRKPKPFFCVLLHMAWIRRRSAYALHALPL